MSKFISSKVVKTRKEHQCWGCCAWLPEGTTVRKEVWEDMGQVFSTYMCELCEKVLKENGPFDSDDTFAQGELRAEYPEYYKKDTWPKVWVECPGGGKLVYIQESTDRYCWISEKVFYHLIKNQHEITKMLGTK